MRFESINCFTCGKPTQKLVKEINRNSTGRMYCSKSCAAQSNNKLHPKRSMEGMCKCGKPTNKYRTYCNECWGIFSIEDKTYGEFKKGTKYQKNSRVRTHARKKYFKSELPKCCIVCGYSKHIDICHVRDISSFPDETLIKEINDLSNLVALCKNHHWEFDNKCMYFDDNLKVEVYLSEILPAGVAPA